MTTVTFDTFKFVDKLEKAGLPREQAAAIVDAQREAFVEAIGSQSATKVDLMEMENRLVKWSIGLALGQVAMIAALVKML